MSGHRVMQDIANAARGLAYPADGGTVAGAQIGSSATDKVGFYGADPVVQPASANQAATGPAAPAGGTGAAAGAWDTAANRDLAITLINETRTLVNQLRSELVTLGLIKGSA